MTAFLRHLAGEHIQDRYRVLSILGSGAFGTVYKCLDTELDTLVAVKELHVLDEHERAEALAQFRREAVNLSQLRHPHIVSGHYQPHSGMWLICPICGLSFKGSANCPQHGAAPVVIRQRHYLVTEYLAGPDLAEAAHLGGGILPVDRAVGYLRQVAHALTLIHGRGLIHRDVKPENIRLRGAPGSGDDDAVLLDFGIATQSGEAGDFSTRAVRHTRGGGTAGYAPDSPQERRHPDARSDIHALGMTLYSLLSGRDPLEDDELYQMRAHAPRSFNAQIPAHIENLILRAIDPDPAQRPQSADEFARALLAQSSHVSTHMATSFPTHAPAMPFTFRNGAKAQDVEDLVILMDGDRSEAKEYLYSGDFARWFSQIGRADLAQRAREIVDEYPDRRYQGLEALSQSTGLVEPPTLEAQPKTLDFGVVEEGKRKTLPLRLRNVGRGHLFGLLRSTHPALRFDEGFEGNRHTVPVTFDSARMPRGVHEGEVVIDSSAGEMRVPFRAQVRGQQMSFAAPITIVGWGILGMIAGQLLRGLPVATVADKQGRSAAEWLSPQFPIGDAPWSTLIVFGAILWLIFLVFTVGEATRRKSWMLFFGAGAMSLPLAILMAFLAGPLMIAGDAALRPAMQHLTGNLASNGWMVAGGFFGAIYGTLRRLRDIFSWRIGQVIFGWIFFYAMLWSVIYLLRFVEV